MLLWTKFQSTHSQTAAAFYVWSDLYFIQDSFTYSHTHTCNKQWPPFRSMYKALLCMFHVHSFINKFSQYRSFGDDFRLSIFSVFHRKSSNRTVRLTVNHVRCEPKTICASSIAHSLESVFGFWFDADTATAVTDARRQKKQIGKATTERYTRNCGLYRMIAKYFSVHRIYGMNKVHRCQAVYLAWRAETHEKLVRRRILSICREI